MTQLTQPSVHLRVVAMGFWIPCLQSDFFHHKEDIDILATIPHNHHLFSPSENHLESSIFRRLMAVLYHKHYDYVYPIPFHRTERKKELLDPHTLIFATSVIKPIQDEDGAQLPTTTKLQPLYWNFTNMPKIHGLSLIVNSYGFYIWLVAYESAYSDSTNSSAIQLEAEPVQAALQSHIIDIVGGSYFSHFSGLKKEENKVLDKEEREKNIQYYRDQLLGILTFTQMNTILEGIYNSMFDPQVFFYGEEGFQQQKADEKKREYSIGNYINLIATPLVVEELLQHNSKEQQEETSNNHNHTLQNASDVAKYLSVLNREQPLALIQLEGHDAAAQKLNLAISRQVTYKRILYRFLRASSDQCLQTIKRRIERCRRALLSELIEITHRRLPLIQIEPPVDENDDHIDGVNEDQLRGYIMLLAAKLPLIQDIGLHVKEINEHFSIFQKHEEGIFVLHSWELLLGTIGKQIERLEATIQQASLDRQLYEEQKIRTEEENLAEIERLRSRTEETIAPIETKTVSFISNFLALSAVSLTLFSFLQGTNVVFPRDLFQPKTLIVSIEIIVTAIVLTLVYLGVQNAVVYGHRLWRKIRRQGQKINEVYYYEFDIHLSSPITAKSANALLKADFYDLSEIDTPKQSSLVLPQKNVDQIKGAAEAVKQKAEEASQAVKSQDLDRTQQAVDSLQEQAGGVQDAIAVFDAPLNKKQLSQRRQRMKKETAHFFANPIRSSYRVERLNADSSLHKVYIELDTSLPSEDGVSAFIKELFDESGQKSMQQKYKTISIHTFLVYEIFFHQPAASQSFILQNLRVIINCNRVLTASQLAVLKLIVQKYFVSKWIQNKNWEADNIRQNDSFFALTTP